MIAHITRTQICHQIYAKPILHFLVIIQKVDVCFAALSPQAILHVMLQENERRSGVWYSIRYISNQEYFLILAETFKTGTSDKLSSILPKLGHFCMIMGLFQTNINKQQIM